MADTISPGYINFGTSMSSRPSAYQADMPAQGVRKPRGASPSSPKPYHIFEVAPLTGQIRNTWG